MRTIPLYGKKAAGRVALVDDQDYALVAVHRWSIMEEIRAGRPYGPYARTYVTLPGGRQVTIRMHNLILDCAGVDHINQNGIDNRRANLRPATKSQNAANQRPVKGKTSQFKGVCWYRATKWQAYITVSGNRRHLGYFDAEEDAARAYDTAALAAWGDYACLNFPSSSSGS